MLRPEWAATASVGDRAGRKWTKVAVKVQHKTIGKTLIEDLVSFQLHTNEDSDD